MIQYKRFFLDNGLEVIIHTDNSSPLVTINTLYKVGSRDETPDKTGFAHLFEHLMFAGSENVKDFDSVLEQAGGENNAFTSNDITNYYITLPSSNIETALWIESDRMKALHINKKSLDIQRQVVIEEFKEHYINQPYGDVWHLLSELAYKTHPYQWPTIGKNITHIEQATLDDVRAFFAKYYIPNNAILVIAGPIEFDIAKSLVEKWYSDIPKGQDIHRHIPMEEEQTIERSLTIKEEVPVNYIYKTYKMCERIHSSYQTIDLISDILGSGDSSRFTQKLIKEKKLFNSINAYVTGTLDQGLFVIDAKVADDVEVELADKAIVDLLEEFKATAISEYELQKVKNQIESYNELNDIDILNRATNLAYYSYMGDVEFANTEISQYLKITVKDIQETAQQLFNNARCCNLYYLKKN
ncbi:MAG: pitrilysin family protein [Bacteroidota bacterium]